MVPAIHKLGLHVFMLVFLSLGMASFAFAVTEAGQVVNMEGSLVARNTEGVLRPLTIGKSVFAGDMLFTGKKSHARIKFSDGGIMTLKPHVQFLIENFGFDASQPKNDKAVFTLIKGGLRAVSGLVGKRGDPDSYAVKTRAATIGIRGTDFGLLLCKGDCAGIETPDGLPLEDGLHVDVLKGEVLVRNAAGSKLVRAGEFSYIRSESVAPIQIPSSRGTRVDIPHRMTIDKVRGLGRGGHSQGFGGPGAGGSPNVCPAN